MPITPNNPARSDDFIYKSEQDATPSNDNGRVPKLEQVSGVNRKLHPDFIPENEIEYEVGEDINGSTTPKAVFVHDGNTDTTKFVDVPQTLAGDSDFRLDPGRAVGGLVNIGDIDFVTSFFWSNWFSDNMDSTDQISGKIYAVDGSNLPTGSPIATKTQNYSSGFSFTFSSPVALTPNTVYAFVVENNANSAGEQIGLHSRDTNYNSIFEDYAVGFNGSIWEANFGGNNDYPNNFEINGYQDLETGKLYKSVNSINQRNRIDGYVSVNSTDGDVVGMKNKVISGFTGLVDETSYYVSSDGAISTSANGVFAGKALGTTKIDMEYRGAFGAITNLVNSGSGVTSYTFAKKGFATCWFLPDDDYDSEAYLNGVLVAKSDYDGGTIDNEQPGAFAMPVNVGDQITFSNPVEAVISIREI